MLCGRILSALKDKWKQFYFWIWLRKSSYFYCKSCCVGCKFFGLCFSEFLDTQYHPEEYEHGEGYYQQDSSEILDAEYYPEE